MSRTRLESTRKAGPQAEIGPESYAGSEEHESLTKILTTPSLTQHNMSRPFAHALNGVYACFLFFVLKHVLLSISPHVGRIHGWPNEPEPNERQSHEISLFRLSMRLEHVHGMLCAFFHNL